MTIVQIIDAFTFYGFDVLLLSALTCALVQLLKCTVMKKRSKKLLTLAPFLFGTLLYAGYAALKNWSLTFVLDNLSVILEYGISVGSLSTVAYIWYEQFVRERDQKNATQSVIAALIEGFVPTDALEETAAEIADAIRKDVTGDGAAKAVSILSERSEGCASERDLKLLAKLIIETLAHITATAKK